jgi:peptidoglycan/LPS O-acetylase OafA/YrhL
MRALKWVFPIGAALAIGGVFFYAELERHSFQSTDDWEFAVLSRIFIPALLFGSVLAIVGSLIDRRRLPVARTRIRGMVCWIVSGISLVLLAITGNVHGWTFTFIFPAFVGLLTGAVFLSKLRETSSNQ